MEQSSSTQEFIYRHTIFTPIYNRADQLEDVFHSIRDIQYDRSNFEWLIVDDGSTDNILEVIDRIMSQKEDMNIRVIHKKNGGIHTAQNAAVLNAKGEFVTRIDSDDRLLSNCLMEKDKAWNGIPVDQREKFLGVSGLCLNPDMTIRGMPFPEDVMDTTGTAIHKQYKDWETADRNFCFRTEIMRQYLIPEFEDTKWVPEGIIWCRIERKYLTRYVNIPFSVCAPPNENSMTGTSTPDNNMSGYYGSIFTINEQKDQTSFLAYYHAFYNAVVYAYFSKRRTLKKMLSEIESPWNRFLMVLAYLPSRILLLRLKNRQS